MNDEFARYAKSLGMGDVLIERVNEIYARVSTVCPEEITHLVITDNVQQDGTRTYDGLFFFSPNYAIDHKSLSDDRFELDRIGRRLVNLLVATRDFDLQHPTKKSRLQVRYVTADELVGDMRASGRNALHLITVTKECLATNFLSDADQANPRGRRSGASQSDPAGVTSGQSSPRR